MLRALILAAGAVLTIGGAAAALAGADQPQPAADTAADTAAAVDTPTPDHPITWDKTARPGIPALTRRGCDVEPAGWIEVEVPGGGAVALPDLDGDGDVELPGASTCGYPYLASDLEQARAEALAHAPGADDWYGWPADPDGWLRALHAFEAHDPDTGSGGDAPALPDGAPPIHQS